MGEPLNTVCAPWASADDVDDYADLCGLPAGIDEDTVLAKIDPASDLLYRMSGHRWPGVCDITVRPCGTYPNGDGGPVAVALSGWPGDLGWWVPRGISGTLAVNCLGGGSCSCLHLKQVWLPGVIVDIDEVVIDGAVVSPSAYRVDDWRFVVRTDGGVWPCCQRLDLPDGQPGTWSISYQYGGAPPPSGVDAVIALAIELAKACAGDDDCALPANAVRASRQGVEFELSPADLLSEGRTGIYLVDLFLRAVNPYGLTRSAGVRSPDIARHRVAGSEWVS